MVALGTGLLIGGAATVAVTTLATVVRDGPDRTAVGGAVLLLANLLLVVVATTPHPRGHRLALGVAVFACCMLASALLLDARRT